MIARPDGIGYHELAAILRERIEGGQLQPGARVPSERDLVQAYGCANGTARRAIDLLRQEGLVVVRHGYPTRVAVPVERTEVLLELGSTLVVRRATPAERADLGLPLGAFVVVVSTIDDATVVYPADHHIFRPM